MFSRLQNVSNTCDDGLNIDGNCQNTNACIIGDQGSPEIQRSFTKRDLFRMQPWVNTRISIGGVYKGSVLVLPRCFLNPSSVRLLDCVIPRVLKFLHVTSRPKLAHLAWLTIMTHAFLLILTIFSYLFLALGAPTAGSIELDKRITHTGRVSPIALTINTSI